MSATASSTSTTPTSRPSSTIREQLEAKIAFALAHRVDRILLCLEAVGTNSNYLAALRTADVLGVQRVAVIHRHQPQQQQQQQGQAQQGAEPAAAAPGWPPGQGRKKGRVSRAAAAWLDVDHFASSAAAIRHLRAEGWTIWATDLGPDAVPLTSVAPAAAAAAAAAAPPLPAASPHSSSGGGCSNGAIGSSHACSSSSGDSGSGSSTGQPGRAGPLVPLPPRLAVVVGSEAAGISAEMRAAADRRVCLPMYGFTESLNVGVAVGLMLQTLIAADPGVRGSLLGGEARGAQLAAKWRAAVAGRGGGRAAWPGATLTQAAAKARGAAAAAAKQQQEQEQEQQQQAAEQPQQQQQHLLDSAG